MRSKIRFALAGLLAAGSLALAPAAFARSHVSLGVNIGLPGISLGIGSGCYHCGYGYYGAVYAPAYYEPAYYAAPAYGAVYYDAPVRRGYYSGRYYDRGHYHDRGYDRRSGYYDRGGYGHR